MKNGVIILGEGWASHLYAPEAFSYLERGSFPKLLDGKWDYQLRLMSTVLQFSAVQLLSRVRFFATP